MIHHVFANRSNIGDWLAARRIQHLLRPLTVKEHLCDEPFVEFVRRHRNALAWKTVYGLEHAGAL